MTLRNVHMTLIITYIMVTR